MTAYDDAIAESDLYHGDDEDYEPAGEDCGDSPPDDATDSVTDEEIDARAEQTARERQQ